MPRTIKRRVKICYLKKRLKEKKYQVKSQIVNVRKLGKILRDYSEL